MLVKTRVLYLLFSTIVVGTIPNLFLIKTSLSSSLEDSLQHQQQQQQQQRDDPIHPLEQLSSQPHQRSFDTQQQLAFHTSNRSLEEVSSSRMSSSGSSKASNNNISSSSQSASDENDANDVCGAYQGILLITEILPTAGAGTVFFQSLLSSLLYAKRYNLYPWIHVNATTVINTNVYDTKVHGVGQQERAREANVVSWQEQSFSHVTGDIPNLLGEGRMKCTTTLGIRPGPPDYTTLKMKNYTLVGNGMWESYFEPVRPISRRLLEHGACSSLPIFKMSFRQAATGMCKCSEVAVRAWPYLGTPEALMPRKDQSMHDWLGDNRKRATAMVQEYYRPLPWLKERIHQANPVTDRKCLSIHVRLTDKANGRDKKGVGSYLPYAETFVNMTNHKYPIYLATDDATVVTNFQQSFPADVTVLFQENAIRSTSATPTFELLKYDTHRSNTEALVDIYAMAKCSYFIHGYSGMSEAVVYISPELHEQSINLDDPQQKMLRKSLKAFRGILEAREKQ